jgi:hypothetical protein
MASDASIEAQLARIRRWRAHVWLILLGYLPTMIAVVFPLKALGVDLDIAAPLIAVPYLLLFAGAGVRVSLARCPRCRKRFHQALFWGNPWARSCLHCGLPIRSADSPSDDVNLGPLAHRGLAVLMGIAAFALAGMAAVVAYGSLRDHSAKLALAACVPLALAIAATVLARRLLRSAKTA